MEIKRVNKSISLDNNESQHQERNRYEPLFKYLNETSDGGYKIPSKEEVKSMINQINNFLKEQNTSIQYEYHEKLEEYFVKVVDRSTNKVVREIPPKKLLDLYAYIKEKLGLIIDKKA